MKDCGKWFYDETFSEALSIFTQLYIYTVNRKKKKINIYLYSSTLRRACYSIIISSVYILFPDKKESSYRDMFEKPKRNFLILRLILSSINYLQSNITINRRVSRKYLGTNGKQRLIEEIILIWISCTYI